MLMGLTGLALFGLYALGAYGGYLLLRFLWRTRPDPTVLVIGIVLSTLALGYLSYTVGTARLLAGLRSAPVARDRAPNLPGRLDRLVETMDADRPALHVGTLPEQNALTIGSGEDAVVVFDERLLRALTLDEAEAIMAHELAHLEGHDALLQTLAYSAQQTLVGLIQLVLLPVTLLVSGLARAIAWIRGRPSDWSRNPAGRLRLAIARVVVVAFALVTVIVRAYARSREFQADERAATVTGDPAALASALRTIERLSGSGHGLIGQLTTGGSERNATVFSTHPSTDRRVERLRDIAERQERERWTAIPVE